MTPPPAREFARRTLIVLAIGAVAALVWALHDLLLLLFAAVLFGIILRTPAEWIAAKTGMKVRWSLTLVTLTLAVLLVGGLWAFGADLYAQGSQLAQALPSSLDALRGQLNDYPYLQQTIDQAKGFDYSKLAGGVLPPAFHAVTSVLGGVIDLVLVLFGGLYLAAEPELYEKGLLSLVPRGRRERIAETLSEIHRELKHWLLGQLVSMAIVGVFAGAALWASGVQAALALAIITGLSEFVPLVGPLAAAAPALLIAVGGGGEQVLWVAITYLVIHEFESNVLTPLVQRRAASMPPLFTVGMMAASAVLLGLPGLIFATPLAVAVMVTVRMLYVEDVLGGPAE